MIKYGISYYTAGSDGRQPQSGLQVRLLRPGQAWDAGIPLIEKGSTGYYEAGIDDENDGGLFEVHDNRENPAGSFSGRTVIIGKVDTKGIYDASITGNHLTDGAVTSTKIANGAIQNIHLQDGSISMQKVQHQIENHLKGIGGDSGLSPAVLGTDKSAIHYIEGSYSAIPVILLSPKCDTLLWLDSITLSGDQLSVEVGFGKTGESGILRYDLVIIA